MTRTTTISLTALGLSLLLAGCQDRYERETPRTFPEQDPYEVQQDLQRSRSHVDSAAADALGQQPGSDMTRPMSPGEYPTGQMPGQYDEPGMMPGARPGGEVPGQPGTAPSPTADDDLEPQAEVSEAVRRLGREASESKDAFVTAARRRLEALDSEIEGFDTRTEARRESMKAELREQKRRLESELQQLGNRAETGFNNARDSFANGLLELEQRISEARESIVEPTERPEPEV